MKNKPVRKPVYSLSREESSPHRERYQSLRIKVSTPHPWSDFEYTQAVTLRWQAHWLSSCEGSSGPSGWYAYHMEVPEMDRFEDLERAYNVLRTVEKKMEGKCRTPKLVLEVMKSLGWERREYDKRLSRMLLIKDIMPPEYEAWMVDYKASGIEGGNPCSLALARDEEDAQRTLTQNLMTSGRWSTAEERLVAAAKWLAAGKPVENLTRSYSGLYSMYSAPVVRDEKAALESPLEEKERKAQLEEVKI